MHDVLGETIRSESQSFTVECHQLYTAPPFGGFVRAECPSGCTQFAVVTGISTGPFDGNRIVQAHRLAPGELEQRKPHLTTVLRTVFEARLIGYGRDGRLLIGTPPSPPRLHCFVYPASADEVRRLTASPGFLRALVQAQDVPVEDLLVCAIESARGAWGVDAPVVAWGKYLARVLGRDYLTLEGVFQRLSSPAPPPGKNGGSPGWEKPLPLAGDGRPSPSDYHDPFAE